MISKFDSRYIFPSRKTIKEMVIKLYEERKKNIIQDLNNISGKFQTPPICELLHIQMKLI